MIHSRSGIPLLGFFTSLLVGAGCSAGDIGGAPIGASGGSSSAGRPGGASGRPNQGGTSPSLGGSFANGGSFVAGGTLGSGGLFVSGGFTSASGGAIGNSGAGGSPSSGGSLTGGSFGSGGLSSGGTTQGGTGQAGASKGGTTQGGTSTSQGGSKSTMGGGGAKASGGTLSSGGAKATGGASMGGTSMGGTSMGGKAAGTGGSGGATTTFACDGTTTGYDATAIQSGGTWTVTRNGATVATTTDMATAMSKAWGSLPAGRTTKASVLVQGSGDISASAQLGLPSYLTLNVCGTINVSGTASGSDRSPIYGRSVRDIYIPNLKMTGAPQYGIFFRLSNDIHLGNIDMRLSSGANIGIRVDNHPSSGTTAFNQNLTIDYVYGTGMASQLVETYGINNIKIGTVEGLNVGECGLLLNWSTNAEIGLVSCDNCGAGTGYAAFRIANDAGRIGSTWPTGNIHVGKVYARRGGRGIFSVSNSGGLVIDQVDIANTGGDAILLENCHNTSIATQSGTVAGPGGIRIAGTSSDITIRNLAITNSSLVEDPCATNSTFTSNTLTGSANDVCP